MPLTFVPIWPHSVSYHDALLHRSAVSSICSCWLNGHHASPICVTFFVLWIFSYGNIVCISLWSPCHHLLTMADLLRYWPFANEPALSCVIIFSETDRKRNPFHVARDGSVDENSASSSLSLGLPAEGNCLSNPGFIWWCGTAWKVGRQSAEATSQRGA